jgi:hypothetical protein
MSPYSFNVETRRFESRMKADGEVVEEARLSENIPCDPNRSWLLPQLCLFRRKFSFPVSKLHPSPATHLAL